jgi:glycosyltransferase involved in cell wall biosynthesis
MPPLNGGIGTAVADLAPALAEWDIEVTILGVYSPEVLRQHQLPAVEHLPGYTVHRIASRWTRLPHRWRVALERWTLRRAIRRLALGQPPDLLLADDYEGWLSESPLPEVPLVTRLNGSNCVYDALLKRPGDAVLHRMEQQQLAQSDAWIGVSQFFLDQTLRHSGVAAPAATQVIPNAIDVQRFNALPMDQMIPGRIVFHNTLGPRKGLQDLLRAFVLVQQRCPEASLLLCGSTPNAAWLEAQLSELPAQARAAVTLAGRVGRDGELQSLLGRAAVACYPSHLETFGLAPVEAMAMERVTVYADCGPAREVIKHGRDGFICPMAKPEALAETLLEALALSPDQRQRIGRAARATVLNRFDRPVVAAIFARFLRLMASSSSSTLP